MHFKILMLVYIYSITDGVYISCEPPPKWWRGPINVSNISVKILEMSAWVSAYQCHPITKTVLFPISWTCVTIPLDFTLQIGGKNSVCGLHISTFGGKMKQPRSTHLYFRSPLVLSDPITSNNNVIMFYHMKTNFIYPMFIYYYFNFFFFKYTFLSYNILHINLFFFFKSHILHKLNISKLIFIK